MDDKLLIHVNIDGYRVPLRIIRSDEEIYRRAEKMLMDQLNEYKTSYLQLKYEEILKLAAFQLATELAYEELSTEIVPVIEKVKELDREIDKILQQE